MKSITQLSRGLGDWQRFLSIAATLMVTMVIAFAMTGCGGGGSSTAVPVVAAPGAPTALTATAGENVVDLQWSPPAVSSTTGLPDSYEIYRSDVATTAAGIVNSTNLVASMPVVSGMLTSYTDTGLPGTVTYNYVVTAKNAGGETPSNVASARPTGSPNPIAYGNNFSAALIFADNIGITNLKLDPAKSWAAGTADVTQIDTNTGLRPLVSEIPAISAVQATLPYLTSITSKIDPSYWEQKSINTWQGEWAAASGVQDVTAKWGDNLTGTASLSSGAKIRIEMVLTKDVTATPMTAYTMKLLSGSGINELWGTDGTTYPATTAFVMATNAHLMIQKFNGTALEAPIVDQALFNPAYPDGLNKLSAEIPVSGNFTYGFVWDPSALGATAGKYRLTFLLDPFSEYGTGNPPNNTHIQSATNGVYVSPTEVYIDINVK